MFLLNLVRLSHYDIASMVNRTSSLFLYSPISKIPDNFPTFYNVNFLETFTGRNSNLEMYTFHTPVLTDEMGVISKLYISQLVQNYLTLCVN